MKTGNKVVFGDSSPLLNDEIKKELKECPKCKALCKEINSTIELDGKTYHFLKCPVCKHEYLPMTLLLERGN